MTDQSIQDLQRTFELYDIEKVGRIRTADMSKALQSLDKNGKGIAPEDIKAVLECFEDKEEIDFQGFEDAFQRLELHTAFRQFDRENKGWITKPMLREILMPMVGDDMSEAEISETIENADQDKDGAIDIKEFVDLMMME